jgi:hypothetical protein
MTARKTIIIEVEMFSNASEASLCSHLDSFVDEMKENCKMMAYRSWDKVIYSSHDESYPVDISVSIK